LHSLTAALPIATVRNPRAAPIFPRPKKKNPASAGFCDVPEF
jgi:hypothetical protein